jgi:hypothetical protein
VRTACESTAITRRPPQTTPCFDPNTVRSPPQRAAAWHLKPGERAQVAGVLSSSPKRSSKLRGMMSLLFGEELLAHPDDVLRERLGNLLAPSPPGEGLFAWPSARKTPFFAPCPPPRRVPSGKGDGETTPPATSSSPMSPNGNEEGRRDSPREGKRATPLLHSGDRSPNQVALPGKRGPSAATRVANARRKRTPRSAIFPSDHDGFSELEPRATRENSRWVLMGLFLASSGVFHVSFCGKKLVHAWHLWSMPAQKRSHLVGSPPTR